MNQLNVAITVPVFPNIVQTYVLSQLAAFKTMGVKFTIIAGKRRTYRQLPPIISEHNLLDDTIYISTNGWNIVQQILSLPFGNASYRVAVGKILAGNLLKEYGMKYLCKALIRARALAFRPFDIIHSHSMFSSFNYLFMKDALSIPMITTYHGMVPRGVNKLDKDRFNMVLDKGDLFLVNTEYAKNELVQLGCSPEKIRTIPQGTNLDLFPFRKRCIDTDNKIILLTVGRLSIEKGHHVAIQALAELVDEYPTLEYHLVGDGPEKDNLARLSAQHGLADKVKLHGFMTGDNLRRCFSEAHLFVLPSINTGDGYLVETQGVVLQEAQACGIPVIGSRTGGIPDVIRDHETGLLFEEDNHHALADNIRRLINDPALYQNVSLSGRQDVEQRFDIHVVCQQLISVYEEILDQKKLKAR